MSPPISGPVGVDKVTARFAPDAFEFFVAMLDRATLTDERGNELTFDWTVDSEGVANPSITVHYE